MGHVALLVFGLAHDILVLTALSSNRDSSKYAHMRMFTIEHSLLAYTKYECS